MTEHNSSDVPRTTVGEVCTFVGSGVTPRGGSEVYVDSGVLFIRSQNVYSDGLRLDDVAHIPDQVHEEMRRSALQPYDVLYNITGASIGRCTYFPDGLGPANVNQHVCLLRLHSFEERDSMYLALVLDSDIGRRQLRALNAGSNREGLNYQQLRSFEVPWPPAATRHRIAEIFNMIDESIQATERVIAKLEVGRQGLLDDLLGAVEQHERLGENLERIDAGWSPACAERPPSGSEWGVLKVSSITREEFNPVESKTLPPSLPPRPDLIVRVGDVLTARANGVADLVGRTAFVDHLGGRNLLISDKTLRLVPGPKLSPRYLAYCMQHEIVRSQVRGLISGSTGQGNISQAELRSLRLAIPPRQEQHVVESVVASVDGRLIAERHEVSKLRSLRTGLAADLLSGRVRTVAT